MDVGINLKFSENLTSVAPSMTNSMKGMQAAAKEMKEAFKLVDVMPEYKKFADMLDQFEAYKRAFQSTQPPTQPPLRRVGPSFDAGRSLQRTGTVAGQLGSGNVVGGAGTLAGTLKDALGAAGPAGAVLGIAAGGLFLLDALTQQYEKQLDSTIKITSQMERLGGSVQKMSAQFLTTMDEIATSAGKFGYGIEQGFQVYQGILRAGGRGAIGGAASEVMQYARGFGMELSPLAEFSGIASRFGQGGALARTLGSAQQAGLGPARYQEFLQGTLSIFEEGISRGIVKGFTDINQTQVWLSQLGEVFKGQTGIDLYRKMESSVVGATGLSTESDAIMFQAAKRLTDKTAGSSTYIDIMKRLEAGVTPELFGEVKNIVQGMSANRSDQVEMMRQLFGVNYTVADELLGLGGKVAANKIAEAPQITDTPEIRLMRAQNAIMEDIRKIGYSLIDAKMYAIEGAETVITGLTDLIGANVNAQQARREAETWQTSTAREQLSGTLQKLHVQGRRNILTEGLEMVGLEASPASKLQTAIDQAIAEGGNSSTAAKAVISYLNMFEGSADLKHGLAQAGGLRRLTNVAAENITGAEAYTPGGTGVSGSDMPIILQELVNIMKELNANIVDEKQINMYVETGGVQR